MKKNEQLVWKLIEREISEDEFRELQDSLTRDRELRQYYQSSLETHAVLSAHFAPISQDLRFPQSEKEKPRGGTPLLWSGWAAAVLLLLFFISPVDRSGVSFTSSEDADWRGIRPIAGEAIPHRTLHLQKGSITLEFPTQTTASIAGPAFFQVIDGKSLEIFAGEATIHHRGEPGEFTLLTPVGELKDLGTRFQASIRNQANNSMVITEVLEGKVAFANASMNQNKIFKTGESITIVGTSPHDSISILPGISPDSPTENQSEGRRQIDGDIGSEPELKAIDLMLEGNLKAQINHSIIESIAESIDEKTKILENAELSFHRGREIEFAEAAMPEIEAMAHSIVEGCVDFSKISLWAASKTAEIAWIENTNDQGELISRIPYANRLEEPGEGNRLLSNLEKIGSWLESVHQLHRKKGMGWVSSFGCPEDGKLIFENRRQKLFAINQAIASIKSNLE